MIFVTVGNANQKFGRLLNAVEKLTSEGYFANEKVIVQTGNNIQIQSKYCEEIKFLAMDKFEEMISIANLIISHGGAGTLLHVLSKGKKPVVMPRRKKYEEHVDDHQVEIVEVLSKESRIIPAYEAEELAGAIAEARKENRQPWQAVPPRMLLLVDEVIKELAGTRK